MAVKELHTIISLRRDTEANYPIDYVPRYGEVNFIDKDNKVRFKVGDGFTKISDLEYQDLWIEESFAQVILRGNYLNGKFYKDSTYQEELPKYKTSFYIDLNSNVIYQYDGEKFISVNDVIPTATESVAGIMKLYNTSGQNEDGSMTQKSITNGISNIKLNIDSTDSECLVLDLPW